ncbi:methylornithine synthase PylB [Candidatus Methanomassiliicoccus intestinalis]|uniref:Methylornithine Synthase n=2 Tax=Candidatus Methanomassiliicoccus intestinalis TaxID=1406512 RepID=R9T9D6_METII|nr:methylornithine synthase PylB [Candidatus Methanomassiliicoccus intestinalis]AGN26251.1 Methylornithine Synthase [Candidatus Methanomassiliicoccus intestinalis Issoire-Mx1]TQS84674.1 MAG: methylornithine synthase PylB [Candidatus Methanomassiliicoccus intestinalis]
MKDADITPILQKSLDGQDLTVTEIEALLAAEDQNSVARLFEAARTVKTQYFGNKVFLYGFVYFSTHCRNNCSFCFYRSSNTDSVRYRKTDDEILELATSLEDSGVHVIDLTMGEDPLIHNDNHYNRLTDLVKMVNNAVDIPLMVSPGAIPERLFPVLMENGADWIACYQETHNMELFKKLRPDQDYEFRLNQKKWADKYGLLAEEGIMIGVGESVKDRADSIDTMRGLNVNQVRAMSFVPQENTPMSVNSPSPFIEELKAIAVMRLVHPKNLIPASLDVEGVAGLKTRLAAGANVITSIIPPRKGLAGVAQHELDIDDGGRSVEQIEAILDDINVKIADKYEYINLIESWKNSKKAGVSL